MSSAKPVVATLQSVAMEMNDASMTGIIISLNDPQQASILLEKMITDKQLRMRMGKAGREKVLAHYSLEGFENKMIKILE